MLEDDERKPQKPRRFQYVDEKFPRCGLHHRRQLVRELRSTVFDFFGLVAQKCPTDTGKSPAATASEVDF